jgi:hypothetical protein
MMSLEDYIEMNKKLTSQYSLKKITLKDDLELVEKLWDCRAEIVNKGYMPYVYSFDGSVQYNEHSSDLQISDFITYTIKIKHEPSYYFYQEMMDEDSVDFLNDSYLFETNSQYNDDFAFYESFNFSIWFTHKILLCRSIKTLQNDALWNSEFYNKVLNYTFRRKNPNFRINL